MESDREFGLSVLQGLDQELKDRGEAYRAEGVQDLAGWRAKRPDVPMPRVLLVIDEASGVPEKVFEAAAGSMSGHSATTVLLSNPTRSSGTFYESQTRLANSWWTRRWSCVDSPLVSDEFVDEMRARYGEESNAFRIRVLGEFPLADDDTIVPYHLAEAAMKRDIEVAPNTRAVALQVSPCSHGAYRHHTTAVVCSSGPNNISS